MNTETFIDVLMQAPSDIKEEYKDSKFPKFIKHILMYRDIKKYNKIIDRLKKEGVILNKSILFQFLSILYNEFKPEANYGNIRNISLFEEGYNAIIVASVYWNNIKASIKVKNNDPQFEIELCKTIDEKINSYTFINDIMKCKVKEYKDQIYELNELILDDISSYFKRHIYIHTLED